ncbi:hypothetical protein [Acinetobacter courvalinii]|uniref:hypothetical protein n=1 Tax=Acinetobacter courvalinii TaxID=280147 RepID=UPI0002CFEF3C|nr:hypothetical protein [Acinetobacter courvalinii]ENX06547.1 hypothetical protein F898_03498 [Acinetobacter courvalinii]
MNNILNAQEAFAALQKGKTVLCRYAGDGVLHADKDFSTLDQMPATVFGLPNYEFCIQLEMLEMAGIKFTKPCDLDELERGQEIYVCIFPCAEIHKTKFDNSSDVLNFIRCGVVQRDEENAKLQMKAYHEFLGLDLEFTVNAVPDFEKKSKRKRSNKKEIEAHKDVVIDAIATCIDVEEVETVCSGLDQHGFSDEQLRAITSAKTEKLESLAAENIEDFKDQLAADTPHPGELECDLSVLCDAFITDIENAQSDADLKSIRIRINMNGELSEVEHAELATRLNLKADTLAKQKEPAQPEPVTAAAVAQVMKSNESVHYFDQVKKETAEWNTQLQELLARLPETKTPEEANALVRYTKSWTEEQRQPLLRAISRRLQEFQNPQPKTEPSLMVKIQTAPDLTALDALEIDVGSLDPVIQSDMMRIVNTRRLQLENAANDEGQAS